MSIRFSIQPDNRLVAARAPAKAGPEDFVALIRGLRSAPAYQQGYDVFLDARGARQPVGCRGLEVIAAELCHPPPRRPKGRLAFLTDNRGLWECGELFRNTFSVVAPVEMRFFTRVEDAANWLGLAPEEAEGLSADLGANRFSG